MMKTINHPKDDFSLIDFGDKRLNNRLQKIIDNTTKNANKSILGSSGGRSEAKAFYRLLSNEKFDMEQLIGIGTGAALARMHGIVLLIQDTTDINLHGHRKTEGLGYCSEHIRGIRLHSCIGISPEGVPYGLVSQSYDTRPESKNTMTKAEKSARPIEEKESYRWLETLNDSTSIIPNDVHFVTICDREGDFYELYNEAKSSEVDFIIRVTHDRLSDADVKIKSQIRRTKPLGNVTENIPRDSRNNIPAREAVMEVAGCCVNIKKPASANDESLPPSLTLNLVRITEVSPPNGQEPIEWILATSLPINTAEEVITIVEYYVQRWKIERFHFVLKSGMGVEKIQQRTYERIKPVIFIYSVIALFIMAITYIGRVLPDTSCSAFFDEDEWKVLYRVIHKTKTAPDEPYSMANAVRYLGQLGGYKRSPSDGDVGLQSIWKGLFALYFVMELMEGQE